LKVLILAKQIPYPLADGYNLRIFNYVRNLYRRHLFYLITYGNDYIPEELKQYFEDIKVVKRNPICKEPFNIRKIYKSFSLGGIFRFNQEILDNLKTVIKQNELDVIWICGWEMFIYAPYHNNLPILGDVIDDPFLSYLRELLRPQDIKSFLYLLKRTFNILRFEKRYFKRADRCVVVSETDARVLKRVCSNLPVITIHNGVDTEYFKPMGYIEENPSLIFEGSMDYGPNEDAVIYFCERIFPLIKAEVPETKFIIVGKNPTPKVKALERPDDIIVTGFVQDIRPYLEKASIFVCPMRMGAGIKNKILQAWAMSKPVVATPKSCGGLKAKENENIIIVSKPKEFANAVIDLLRNSSERKRIGQSGTEIVNKYYTWVAKSKELEDILLELA